MESPEQNDFYTLEVTPLEVVCDCGEIICSELSQQDFIPLMVRITDSIKSLDCPTCKVKIDMTGWYFGEFEDGCSQGAVKFQGLVFAGWLKEKIHPLAAFAYLARN